VLIDVAISGDRNVIKKKAEEFLKCKNRAIEIKCMWYVKTKQNKTNTSNKSGN